jgi:alanyl-tRNA synthetase
MLGNFSFGDYFKKEAIEFANELLTKEYGIDPPPAGLHRARERRRGPGPVEEDRRRLGRPGHRASATRRTSGRWATWAPAVPCSEIHFPPGRRHPLRRAGGRTQCLGPACDCDRWIEIWNLVFMQFEQLPDKTRRPLPKPSVDTGMGLERLCAVLGGLRSNYETDLLRALIADVEAASGKKFVPSDYGKNFALGVDAGHLRSRPRGAFLIADGVFPEKTGREYTPAPDHAAGDLSPVAARGAKAPLRRGR